MFLRQLGAKISLAFVYIYIYSSNYPGGYDHLSLVLDWSTVFQFMSYIHIFCNSLMCCVGITGIHSCFVHALVSICG